MIAPRMVTSRGRTGTRPTLPEQASPRAVTAVGRTGNRPSPIQPARPRTPLSYEGSPAAVGRLPGYLPGRTPVKAGAGTTQPPIKSLQKGGEVEETGIYKLHKGERVISRAGVAKILARMRERRKVEPIPLARPGMGKVEPIPRAKAGEREKLEPLSSLGGDYLDDLVYRPEATKQSRDREEFLKRLRGGKQ